MASMAYITVLAVLLLPLVEGLDNGVALTPPLGFLDWERFQCNTNCEADPANCISERLFMEMADVMVKDGYRDAGYVYVCIDDCWLAETRDAQGRLQPDPKRFPSGMKALADYMHARGLKLGIYEDVGSHTCAGFPGSEGHIPTDAQTFADWGIDLVKFDGCYSNTTNYDFGFPAMAKALNATGRRIVYSCEWPIYARLHGVKPDQPKIAATCNMMRQLADIYDSWDSVYRMIKFFGDDADNFSAVAKPGAFNDPDELVIGNFGLSHDQERVQMALYAILATPLLISTDLRNIRASSKAILLSKHIIAINQDPLGIQGKRIKNTKYLSTWLRPVLPTGSAAIAFMYIIDAGYAYNVTVTLGDLGLQNPTGYDVMELFEGKAMGLYKPDDSFTCFVNPTGVFIVKATPRPAKAKTEKKPENLNELLKRLKV